MKTTTSTSTKTTRRRKTAAERAEIAQESLGRATSNVSLANYPAIIAGFIERGIPADQIAPRENVFTFNAWKALGRHVRKGEKGVAVISWVPTRKKERDTSTGETVEREGRRPITAYVFHITQTDPND